MEELHRTHKDASYGWVALLRDWRRSRTRRVVRQAARTIGRGL